MTFTRKHIYLLITALITLTAISIAGYIIYNSLNQPSQSPQIFNSQPDSTSAHFNIPDKQLSPNQPATLPIYINTSAPINHIDLILTFNSTELEITTINASEDSGFSLTETKTINELDSTQSQLTYSVTAPSGFNTLNTDVLLANIQLTPLPSASSSEIIITYTQPGDLQDSNILTDASTDILSQPQPTVITIQDTNSSSETDSVASNSTDTTLSFEPKTLKLNEQTNIDILLNTSETIYQVDISSLYDASYLQIDKIEQSEDFDFYPVIDIDEATQALNLSAESETGIDGSLGEIVIATITLTPIQAASSTSLSFNFTPSDNTDTNVFTQDNTTDILDQTVNQDYIVTENSTASSCYQPCDFSFQCPEDTICNQINGESICIDLDCSDTQECSCPESEYYSTDSSSTSTGGSDSLYSNSNIKSTYPDSQDTSISYSNNTSEQDLSSQTEPELNEYQLPEAGNLTITILMLIIGICTITLGYLIQAKKI